MLDFFESWSVLKERGTNSSPFGKAYVFRVGSSPRLLVFAFILMIAARLTSSANALLGKLVLGSTTFLEDFSCLISGRFLKLVWSSTAVAHTPPRFAALEWTSTGDDIR